MSLNKTKRYTIVQNLEDHEGYNGEELKILSSFQCDYYIVQNNNGDTWFCGEEELKEIECTMVCGE